MQARWHEMGSAQDLDMGTPPKDLLTDSAAPEPTVKSEKKKKADAPREDDPTECFACAFECKPGNAGKPSGRAHNRDAPDCRLHGLGRKGRQKKNKTEHAGSQDKQADVVDGKGSDAAAENSESAD